VEVAFPGSPRRFTTAWKAAIGSKIAAASGCSIANQDRSPLIVGEKFAIAPITERFFDK
jgi:hypothetical protein